MSTGSEDFFLLICIEAVKFVLLSLLAGGRGGVRGENKELKQRRF